MINSDLHCLLDVKSNNILKDTFDIAFSFEIKNKFYRNINGEGAIYERKKYSIFLKGKGTLDNEFDYSHLKFFSSLFLLKSSNHDFFCIVNENDSKNSFQQLFEKQWKNLFFEKQLNNKHFFSNNKKLLFGFPILNVCVVKKSINKKYWILELMEK